VTTRVAFVIPSMLGGGAEFVTTTWAQELVDRSYQVEIILLRARPDEPEPPRGVDVIVGAHLGDGRRAEARAIERYLASDPADIVISMMTRANIQLLRAARRRGGGRPIIGISERNMPFAEKNHSALHLAARNLAYRYYYPRADLFIAISHSVGAAFSVLSGLDSEKVWVVPNPALGKVHDRPSPSAASDAAGLTLVVPGRLVDKKRPMLAVEIADRVCEDVRLERVIFFGDGPLRSDIGRLERSYVIETPGRVERWFEGLPPGSVCLLPSEVEGFANVLLEASSQGIACVVGSTAYGSSDAIIPGVTGEFARTDGVDEYVRAVRAAMTLTVAPPAAWLDVFSTSASVDVLERAIHGTMQRS